jgi:hypothetical protein
VVDKALLLVEVLVARLAREQVEAGAVRVLIQAILCNSNLVYMNEK